MDFFPSGQKSALIKICVWTDSALPLIMNRFNGQKLKRREATVT